MERKKRKNNLILKGVRLDTRKKLEEHIENSIKQNLGIEVKIKKVIMMNANNEHYIYCS